MNIYELYKAATTIEGKQVLLDKMENQDAAESKDLRKQILDSYVKTLCEAENQKAEKTVATDTATMLLNLSYLSESYTDDSTKLVSKVLPAVYAHMIFQLLTDGSGYKTIDVAEVKGDVVNVIVTLHDKNGRNLGTGRVYRLVDRSSYDTPEGQNVTALNLAIGKAFANAYRDCGIGLFYCKEEKPEEQNESETVPAVPKKPAVSAEAPKKETVRTGTSKDTKTSKPKEQQVVVPPKTDSPKAVTAKVETKTEVVPKEEAAPLVGYPTVEEAKSMACSISTGHTYEQMLAMSPKAALISYRKLMAAGKVEETSDELKACHVLIRSNENIREDARRWGLESLYN